MIELVHGDCLEEMENIKPDSVDLVLTDPPYGITACKWDTVIPFDEMWNCINRVIKKNTAVVLFGMEPFSSALRMSNIKKYKYDWYWDKKLCGNPLNAKRQPLKTVELISVFYKKQCLYAPIMREGVFRKKGGSKKQFEHLGRVNTTYSTQNNLYYPTQIIEQSNANTRKNRSHPTQKPVALLEYLIKTYSNEGATVLDFTMGSGSTGVACVNTNRKFIGIELEEKHFNIAKKRIGDALTAKYLGE